jgi:hypothetical protein
MIVAIPSKGRPTRVKSQQHITSARVYVPSLEVDAYRRCGVKNLVPVPNRVRGITATRNWILDHADDRRVVFIDDDVKICGWIELLADHGKHRALTELDWLTEFAKLFDVTEQVGYHLWGLATDGALRSVYPYRPFIFHTYVTGSCMGVVNTPETRFDESYPVKEDYELCLRCIRRDGGIVGARYLYWSTYHWTGAGGCRDYRTQAMEGDAIKRLMDDYPGLIRRVTRGGSEYSIELDF